MGWFIIYNDNRVIQWSGKKMGGSKLSSESKTFWLRSLGSYFLKLGNSDSKLFRLGFIILLWLGSLDSLGFRFF